MGTKTTKGEKTMGGDHKKDGRKTARQVLDKKGTEHQDNMTPRQETTGMY
jgi:hypothetical protein